MTSRPLDGIRVLIVDDHRDTLDLLSLTLSAQGATVQVAAMAREALDLLGGFRPHVLVSDLAMPAFDGYALIEKVRGMAVEQGGRTPALAVTAHAYGPIVDRSLRMGFDEWLAKPVEPQQFVEAVARLAKRAPTAG